MSSTESLRRSPTYPYLTTQSNGPILSTNTCESTPNHADIMRTNTRIDQPDVVDSLSFSIEIESAHEHFETRIAMHTKFVHSLATAEFVASLKLRTFPLPPPMRQRPYHTNFGLLYLKDFVSIPIKAPLAGIPYTVVHVVVLDKGYCWRDVDLFFGSNFRKRVRDMTDTLTNLNEKTQLDQNGQLSALPPENCKAMPSRQLPHLPPTVGLVENTTSLHSPPGSGGLGRKLDPLDVKMDPFSDPDPGLLTPNPPDAHSRTTSRLEGTPFFTIIDHQLSTPPSTLGLDETSRRSYDVTSGRGNLHPITNPKPDSFTPTSISKKDLASSSLDTADRQNCLNGLASSERQDCL